MRSFPILFPVIINITIGMSNVPLYLPWQDKIFERNIYSQKFSLGETKITFEQNTSSQIYFLGIRSGLFCFHHNWELDHFYL